MLYPEDYRRAAEIGISEHTLANRVYYRGWDKEKAITTPIKKRKNRKKWLEIARRNNIPDKVFYNRLWRGWSEEKSATEPVMSRDEVTQKMIEALFRSFGK